MHGPLVPLTVKIELLDGVSENVDEFDPVFHV
jgi:hypothetical protein